MDPINGALPLSQLIAQRYGGEGRILLRGLQKTKTRAFAMPQRTIFLKRCLDKGLTPTFAFLGRKGDRETDSLIFNCEQKIIKSAIRRNYSDLARLNRECDLLDRRMKDLFSTMDYNSASDLIWSSCLALRQRTGLRLNKKLHFLLQKQQPPRKTHSHQQTNQLKIGTTVINLSTRQLSQDEESLLSKGPGFALVPRKIPIEEIKIACEDFGRKLAIRSAHPARPGAAPSSQEPAEHFRPPFWPESRYFPPILNKNLERSLHDFGSCVSVALARAKKPTQNLTFTQRSALKALRNDPDLVIRKADKGNAIVLLDRDTYEAKMHSVLDDDRFFKKLPSNPTRERQLSLNQFLKSLWKNDSIEKRLYRFLRCSNPRTPQAYGLPKIHKEGAPLRPIISAVRAFNYNVGKLLVWILTPYMDKCDSYVKNSAAFVEKVDTLRPGQSTQVSFDVSSLFTNVPVHEAVSMILDKIRIDNESRNWLPIDDLRRLFQFSTTLCNFQFLGQNYDQVDGMAMGNPVAPPVSHLFMVLVETRALNRGLQSQKNFDFRPLTWIRYVDDIYVRLRRGDKNRIPEILNYLNSVHPKITFTCETEKDGCLPFLEVLVETAGRRNGRYRTTVYRKKTHTNLYILWESAHPSTQKLGVFKTLLHRAKRICNDPMGLAEERRNLREIFVDHGYPKARLQACMDVPSAPRAPPQVSAPKTALVLPYIPGLSQKLTRTWRRISEKFHLETEGLPTTVVHRPVGNLKNSLCQLYPQEEPGRCVYRASCGDCDDVYIGETGLKLQSRVKAHSRDKKSAIYAHTHGRYGHDFEKFSFEPIKSEKLPSRRRISEALAIQNEKPTLNRDRGVMFYCFS